MFVVFEGIDGSGETTHCNLAVERRQQRGFSVEQLRAQGRFVPSLSEAIRSLAQGWQLSLLKHVAAVVALGAHQHGGEAPALAGAVGA